MMYRIEEEDASGLGTWPNPVVVPDPADLAHLHPPASRDLEPDRPHLLQLEDDGDLHFFCAVNRTQYRHP